MPTRCLPRLHATCARPDGLSGSLLARRAAGIQFWVTKYILEIIQPPGGQNAIVAPFGITSVFAPTIGVVCGGMFVDKLGGYKGAAALALTLKVCFVFACWCAHLTTPHAHERIVRAPFRPPL